jgi:hypothetical protein
LQNITNDDGEKLVFAEIQKIRKECPQLNLQNYENCYFRTQHAELDGLLKENP